MRNKSFFSATRVTVIAMFSALAGVLYVFGFPINGAFPFWLELNFSDIPALIGAFAMGPVSGSLIVLFKVIIKLVIKGTSTMFVGELADLVIGIAFILPAALIYKKKRTLKGAVLGMAVGTLASIAMSILANWLVLVPFYLQLFFKGSWTPLVGAMQSLFGEGCTQETFYNFYLWASVLPFNAMRCLIAVAVTLPVYKHISRLINKLHSKLDPKRVECDDPEEEARLQKAERKRTAIIIGVTCAVIALLIVGVVLRYYIPIWTE